MRARLLLALMVLRILGLMILVVALNLVQASAKISFVEMGFLLTVLVFMIGLPWVIILMTFSVVHGRPGAPMSCNMFPLSRLFPGCPALRYPVAMPGQCLI